MNSKGHNNHVSLSSFRAPSTTNPNSLADMATDNPTKSKTFKTSRILASCWCNLTASLVTHLGLVRVTHKHVAGVLATHGYLGILTTQVLCAFKSTNAPQKKHEIKIGFELRLWPFQWRSLQQHLHQIGENGQKNNVWDNFCSFGFVLLTGGESQWGLHQNAHLINVNLVWLSATMSVLLIMHCWLVFPFKKIVDQTWILQYPCLFGWMQQLASDIPVDLSSSPSKKHSALLCMCSRSVLNFLIIFAILLVQFVTIQNRDTLIIDRVSVVVYPEGTRSKNPPSLCPFKPGAFHIACTTQRPLLPVVLKNTNKVMGRFLNCGQAEIEVIVLDPVVIVLDPVVIGQDGVVDVEEAMKGQNEDGGMSWQNPNTPRNDFLSLFSFSQKCEQLCIPFSLSSRWVGANTAALLNRSDFVSHCLVFFCSKVNSSNHPHNTTTTNKKKQTAGFWSFSFCPTITTFLFRRLACWLVACLLLLELVFAKMSHEMHQKRKYDKIGQGESTNKPLRKVAAVFWDGIWNIAIKKKSKTKKRWGGVFLCLLFLLCLVFTKWLMKSPIWSFLKTQTRFSLAEMLNLWVVCSLIVHCTFLRYFFVSFLFCSFFFLCQLTHPTITSKVRGNMDAAKITSPKKTHSDTKKAQPQQFCFHHFLLGPKTTFLLGPKTTFFCSTLFPKQSQKFTKKTKKTKKNKLNRKRQKKQHQKKQSNTKRNKTTPKETKQHQKKQNNTKRNKTNAQNR